MPSDAPDDRSEEPDGLDRIFEDPKRVEGLSGF